MKAPKLFLKLAMVMAIASVGLWPAPKAEAALPTCGCWCSGTNDFCYCPGYGKSRCSDCHIAA